MNDTAAIQTRDDRQLRATATRFETRDSGEGPRISGYFAVFNSVYHIAPGMSESIAPGAFASTLQDDIRALTNHDTTLVLGRTAAGTLTLREDEQGLFAEIAVNPNDSDAMNTYERIKRGDVSQCSIGFRILSEDTDVREDGSVHWTIREMQLFEVSVCTFPAYTETSVSARAAQREEIKARALQAWKENAQRQLRGA